MVNINKLAKEIYEQNKAVGWWDDPNRCIYTCLQLVSTEIAEATEAERKDLMDSHLPHRKGGEVELADAVIRVLDLGGRYDWEYDEDHAKEIKLPKTLLGRILENPAALHLVLNMRLVTLVYGLPLKGSTHDRIVSYEYTSLVKEIINVSERLGYTLWDAVFEKLDYNRKRQDHKRSERAKAGGKKF